MSIRPHDEAPACPELAREDTTAVVTGAAGFVGSHLVDRLLALGHEVIGLDRRAPSRDVLAALNLTNALTHPRFRLVEAELDTADLDAVVGGAGCVFHCAAVPGVRASWGARFARYAATNIVGTHRLVGACERAGVRRLVYCSSSSVYGTAGCPSRESDLTRPASPYGVTKLAGEQLCLAHAARVDTTLTVVALRYFSVYGPRQRPDMAIGRVLAAALSGARYTLFGDGTQRRDFTYIDDVVDATIAAAHQDVPTMVLNVGGGSPASLIDVIGIARDVTGRPVPLTAVAAAAGDVPATAADLSLACAVLGYRPRVDLRAGMARQAQWLRGLAPELLARITPPPGPVEELAACSS
jgi:nucleoside-diphosphate-sugar epimerase